MFLFYPTCQNVCRYLGILNMLIGISSLVTWWIPRYLGTYVCISSHSWM